MRIDTIRRTGHEGYAILAFGDAQFAGIVGLDHGNAVDLVAECLAHDLDVEGITLLHLIKASEQQRVRQTAMAGDYRVCGFATDRQ